MAQTDQEWLNEQYQQKFGRAPDQNEQSTDLENIAKYGRDGGPMGGVSGGLEARRTNAPNNGEVDYGSGNQTPTQSWNSSAQGSSNLFPDWYSQLLQRMIGTADATQGQAQGRQNDLYSQLTQRATQGLAVNPSDPTIQPQVDAYRAEQDRARRNYLSDTAEQRGPLANITGERRMAAETAGQNTANFQAQLMGREVAARRDEIAQALSQQQGLLSGDQTRALQAQLAALDQALGQTNATTSRQSVNNQFALGQQQLSLEQQRLQQQQDQFLRELALRAYQVGDNSAYQWATL
jgi:hypothetical protein